MQKVLGKQFLMIIVIIINYLLLDNTITVIFDKYLTSNSITLSLEEFGNLQRLREQPFDLTT